MAAMASVLRTQPPTSKLAPRRQHWPPPSPLHPPHSICSLIQQRRVSVTRRGTDTLRCFSQRKQEERGREVYEFERLFSNLNQSTLRREPGSLSSAVLLVAGTTVGAGILAIPAVTQEAGFLASAVTCICCWVFMVVTGLLIAEVNVKTMCELGSGGVSLVSMAKRTLGSTGVQIACWSYIFIHYALLVAYVARSSEILTNFIGIPQWGSATIFTLLLGSICYSGSQQLIGAINGVLVLGILISFAALVNVVPVLCTDLEGDLPRVRTAIILGTAIPLVLFLTWDAVILGSISNHENVGDKIVDPIQQLQSANRIVGPIVQVFSLLAIATSYIGFVLGLSDFLADLLKLPVGQNKPLPYALTLIPPLILSLLDPEIFFKALDFAGTYGVLVLFGILPAAMSWADRYSIGTRSMIPDVVPGGKLTLSLVMGGAGLVILSEILENFSPR